MVKFIIRWFSNSLGIPLEDFTLRAEFNIDHQGRGEEIEDYWSNLTGIPRSQFNKPYLQKAKLLRDYPDKNNYYGVLRIRVRRSSELLVKLRGWIEGLSSWVPNDVLGDNWTNSLNGVTKEDVVKDLVVKFAAANGHDLNMVHPGDTFQVQQLLTSDQLDVVKKAIATKDAGDYWNNVRPLAQALMKK